MQGVRYAFFSAANAAALQQAQREAIAATLDVPSSGEEGSERHMTEGDEQESSQNNHSSSSPTATDETDSDSFSEGLAESTSDEETDDEDFYQVIEEDSPDAQDPRVKVLSVLELEDLFVQSAPDLTGK